MYKLEPVNPAIVEEMKNTRNFRDFWEISAKYSLEEAFAAFVKVRYGENNWIEVLLDWFFDNNMHEFVEELNQMCAEENSK